MERTNVKQKTFVWVFKQDLKTVWDILKDFSKTNRMCEMVIEGWASPPVFTKHSYTYELGAEFEFVHRKIIKVRIKNVEVVEKGDYARIRYEVFPENNILPNYSFIYTLYADVTGSYTTMILEMIFEEAIQQSKKEQEEANLDLFIVFKNVEKCIEEEKVTKTQIEEIEIKRNFEELWELMLKFKDFQKLIPLVCDVVEYEGDILNEGLKVAFIWNNKHKAYVHLTVKQLLKAYDFCLLVFESFDSHPKVPQQKIEWKLEKIDNEVCRVKLTHMYSEIIRKESLQYSSKIKKKLLGNLKEAIEEGAAK